MKHMIFIVATFVALASPAHADPISAVAAWVGSTFAVGAATALAITQFAVGATLSFVRAAWQKRQMGRMGGASVSFDVQMADDLPLSFVVGRYATAGKRKYIGSWGDNTRFITEVIEYSSLPQGLEGIWINDERGNILLDQGQETLGGIANVGYRLTNYNRDGATRIWVRWLDGTQIAADQTLINLFGGDANYPWTAQHIGRGKSYAIITSLYDDETLTQYPTFLIEPAPLAMYDLRFDSTNGGNGLQRWGDRSTYLPTRNPAVISYNVARGIYYNGEWVFGGKNLPAWRLPVAEWMAAANACPSPVTLADGSTEPRYRCGMEIHVDMEAASVLEELGQSANMQFAEVGGRLKPIVDLPGAAVFAFTDGDILITEGQSFNPFYPATETFNSISATYPEPGEKWSSKDAPEYIDEVSRTADGGEKRPVSIEYGAVPYARQVQRLMRAQMRDFRRMRRHQFQLPPDAYALEPGIDMVSWTSDRNGYVNKLFVVESVAKTPGMNVQVTLREVDPSDYDWSSDFERPIVITPPVNPRPFVQPIRGLTVTGETIRDEGGAARRPAILVACFGDEVGVTEIQIEARRQGTTIATIDTLRRFTVPYAWYLQNVLPLTAYEVRARLLSDLTPRSAWSSWLTVTTPDVRLGSNDVRYDEIIDEVREDLGEFIDWVDSSGQVIRDVRDEIDAIRDGAAEGEFGALLARDGLRRELAVEVGNARASFEEQIDVIITEQTAAAIRTSELRTQFNTSTALVREEMIALTGPDSALASRIGGVEVALNGAVGSAEQGLITRLSQIERVAGSNNRVWRQPFPGPEGSLVTNGDYWQNTGNGNWLERRNNAWSLIPTSSVPRLIIEQSVTSDAITQVTARTDRGTASGLFRATAVSTPAGALSRVALAAEASDGVNESQAALFLEARGDGTNQIIASANRFAIATGTGPTASRSVPFVVDGTDVFMQNAIVRTLSIGNDQVVVPVGGRGQRVMQAGEGVWRNLLTLNVLLNQRGRLAVNWAIKHYYTPGGFGAYGLRIQLNGMNIEEKDTNGLPADFPSGNAFGIGEAGVNVVTLDWQGWGATNELGATGSMSILGVMR